MADRFDYSMQPNEQWLQMPLVQEWGWVAHSHSGNLPQHRNQGYEITYTRAGELVWKVDGVGPLLLRGGQVCLTQPQVLHGGETDSFSPGELFYLVFNPLVEDAQRHTPFTPDDLLVIDDNLRKVGNDVVRANPVLIYLFKELHIALARIEAREEDQLLRPWTQALICQIILATVRSFTHPEAENRSDPIAKACRLLEAHIELPLAMVDVAQEVGLSRSQFYQIFVSETGVTPADYLIRLRCNRAAQALRDSDDSITTIALTHGFNTSQYFATCFRKRTSLSPGEYRGKYGKKMESGN
jgi:AraC family transcriptional regulator, L-rhamnose operon regulatory protein RhaS